MQLFLLDNYDSFTWNLVHYLRELGCEVVVARNDASDAVTRAMEAEAVLISPGPGEPDEAGASRALVRACADTGTPLLGVCLGHQAIAREFGGTVGRAAEVVHGKTGPVTHGGSGVFAGLPAPFLATRYHSLAVTALQPSLAATAFTPEGTVMGIEHRSLPIHGVQFHPESVATEHGHALLGNFLRLARLTRARSVA